MSNKKILARLFFRTAVGKKKREGIKNGEQRTESRERRTENGEQRTDNESPFKNEGRHRCPLTDACKM